MFIYGLFTDQLCWYVGRTTNPKQRYYTHRGKNRTFGAALIPDIYDWEMVVLEETDDRARERHWYHLLRPLLNKEVPTRTLDEWRASNREKVAASSKKYYEANKAKIIESVRVRRAAIKAATTTG